MNTETVTVRLGERTYDIVIGAGLVARAGAEIASRLPHIRVAIVTDTDWILHTLHALGWLVPGELKIFGMDELEQAKQWAAG